MKLIKIYNRLLVNFPTNKKYSDYYCEFLDELSNCVDDMIQNGKDEKLMNEALKLYFRHNELYFGDKDEDECIQYLLDDFGLFKDILNYEYGINRCEVCLNKGDIPSCVSCGREKYIEGNCPFCNKDTLVQGGYCEDCGKWNTDFKEEEEEDEILYEKLDNEYVYCCKCNKVHKNEESHDKIK